MTKQTHISATVPPQTRPKRRAKAKTKVTAPRAPKRPPGPTDLEYLQLFDTCVIPPAKTVELDRVIDDKLLANRARYELVVDLLHGKTFNFGSPNFGSPRVPALGGVSFFQPKRFETSTGTWPLPGVMQQFGFPAWNNPLQPGLQLNPYGLGFDGSLDFSGINSGRIPWYFIGVVHYLECNADFRKHLHNGDPLTGYTVKHPARRPKVGHPPPFTWEESAVDALKLKQFHTKSNWNLPFVLRSLEAYNGFGYYNNKRGNTPYLWSYSNHYTKGKYVKDFKYDADAVSAQLGAAVLLKRMEQRGLIYISRF